MYGLVFGYGSLIWRPDFPYLDRQRATLAGYQRRFWQGSHDHRGIPEAPGRVVTLLPDPTNTCVGVAYLVDAETKASVFEHLDHREKNGYQRHDVELVLPSGPSQGLVYLATQDNFAFLGPAPLPELAAQIAVSVGPSGTNREYLFELATALREIEADDAHVFELESAVKRYLAEA